MQQQLWGLCSWEKGEVPPCLGCKAQAGASIAEASQEAQDGSRGFQYVFWSHCGSPACCFRINSQSFEGAFLKHPHSCLQTYLAEGLMCAFQDKTVRHKDGVFSTKSLTEMCIHVHTHTTLTHVHPHARTHHPHACAHTPPLSCICMLRTTQRTLVSGRQVQAFLVQKSVSM